jgi:polar amino acid transport system substrate-binding protein
MPQQALRLVYCLILFLGLYGSARIAAAQIPVVIYADDSYPPYSYVENGELRGVYPEIFHRIFEQMPDYQVHIEAVPWKRGLKLLETGEGFALFPPYYWPKERPWMEYSDDVSTEWVAVFCNENVNRSQPHNKWPEDFYGLRIGINAGYLAGGEKFFQAAKEGKLVIDSAPGSRSNIIKVLLKRNDCFVNDRFSIIWEYNKIQAAGLYHDNAGKITEINSISQQKSYLGFTNRDHGQFPFKANFIRQFNTVLGNMKKHGEIQQIIERFLKK